MNTERLAVFGDLLMKRELEIERLRSEIAKEHEENMRLSGSNAYLLSAIRSIAYEISAGCWERWCEQFPGIAEPTTVSIYDAQ